MVKTLGIIALGLVVIIGGFLAFVATRSSSFVVERQIQIDAPPQTVFGFINDLHEWAKWSPWEKLDPEMKKSYKGSEKGTGSIYEWEGNKEVGKGRMEIMSAQANQDIQIQLNFIKPFKAQNITEFQFTSVDGQSTQVTWKMTGTNNFMMKLMQLFLDMDKMVGKDFENGLNQLKAVAEK